MHYPRLEVFNNIEWLGTHPAYTVPVQEMEKQQLSECLKKFYQFIRKKDSSFFKVSSLKAIRAAVERFLKSAPNRKPWSIISDHQFKEANDALDAFAKSIRREGKVGGVVQKNPITKEPTQNVPLSCSALRGFISPSTLGKEEEKTSGR